MSHTFTAPVHRLSPVTGLVLFITLAAAIVLGFALRVWTEPAPAAGARTVPVATARAGARQHPGLPRRAPVLNQPAAADQVRNNG